MLMKDPRPREWEPKPKPAPVWPVLVLAAAITFIIVLVGTLMTLTGPQARCVRPIGYHVPGRVALPLCSRSGTYKLPTGK